MKKSIKKLNSRNDVDIVFIKVLRFLECRDNFAIRTIRANRNTRKTIKNVALSERFSPASPSVLKLLPDFDSGSVIGPWKSCPVRTHTSTEAKMPHGSELGLRMARTLGLLWKIDPWFMGHEYLVWPTINRSGLFHYRLRRSLKSTEIINDINWFSSQFETA